MRHPETKKQSERKSCVNLQVVDDDKGPSTKREYEIAWVPAGETLAGKVVDFLGRAPGSQVQLGTSVMVPLFGEQPDMEAREQIAEALLTGVKVGTVMPAGQCNLLALHKSLRCFCGQLRLHVPAHGRILTSVLQTCCMLSPAAADADMSVEEAHA